MGGHAEVKARKRMEKEMEKIEEKQKDDRQMASVVFKKSLEEWKKRMPKRSKLLPLIKKYNPDVLKAFIKEPPLRQGWQVVPQPKASSTEPFVRAAVPALALQSFVLQSRSLDSRNSCRCRVGLSRCAQGGWDRR